MNPGDILLWPDGFWCLREELCNEFLRDDNYRVILHRCDEWLNLRKYPRHRRQIKTLAINSAAPGN
jgi:hypothetical protein